MIFDCPRCKQRLSVPPTEVGKMANCPVCNKRILIPPPPPPEASAEAEAPTGDQQTKAQRSEAQRRNTERQAWKETDPTNPNPYLCLGIGIALLLLTFGIVFPFIPPAAKPATDHNTMEFIAVILYKHFLSSFVNVGFFTWAISILFFKQRKVRHQKAALMLDVLPMTLGKRINAGNVGAFLDHVYALPVQLRDSLMVNRIRKALELFEIRHSSADVREMMVSQSEIDSSRILSSYLLLRAFLWALPLVGFIGTIIGLSHAIAGMNFSNVEDIAKILESINNVTSGLGTAFDATLLGLVLALMLSFPLNALAKQEESNLQTIDAFCNDVLLPRLEDSESSTEHVQDSGALAQTIARNIASTQEQFLRNLSQLVEQMNEYSTNLDKRMDTFAGSLTATQTEFLTGLNHLIQQMNEHTANLDSRSDTHQQTVMQEFATSVAQLRAQNEAAMAAAQKQHQAALTLSLQQIAKHLAGLEAGSKGLNQVLQKLGEHPIVIAPLTAKKHWWQFGRG